MRLIWRTFKDGVAPKEVSWATVVLILKWRGEYQGIGIVEVVWKVYEVVVNFWIKRSVTLHVALHGLRSGRGLGTSTLEEKLVQQLVDIAHNPLFQVILDVSKA